MHVAIPFKRVQGDQLQLGELILVESGTDLAYALVIGKDKFAESVLILGGANAGSTDSLPMKALRPHVRPELKLPLHASAWAFGHASARPVGIGTDGDQVFFVFDAGSGRIGAVEANSGQWISPPSRAYYAGTWEIKVDGVDEPLISSSTK